MRCSFRRPSIIIPNLKLCYRRDIIRTTYMIYILLIKLSWFSSCSLSRLIEIVISNDWQVTRKLTVTLINNVHQVLFSISYIEFNRLTSRRLRFYVHCKTLTTRIHILHQWRACCVGLIEKHQLCSLSNRSSRTFAHTSNAYFQKHSPRQ